MKVCPECKSPNYRKDGFMVTHKNGKSVKSEIQKYKCKECGAGFSENTALILDDEIVLENVRLAKQKQKFQDTNRIERKSFREYARVENALEEYGKALKELAELHAAKLTKIKLPELTDIDNKRLGVIHITDWHGNELINLPHNKFDFEVLSKRAEKLATEAILMFLNQNINHVFIAATGDMLNSDHRLDELLNQATNRAKATFLTAHILKHFILHLRQFFKVTIVSVVGNESRVNKEMPFSEIGLSDNYDFMIFNHLKEMFKYAKIKGVEFGSVDKIEEVVNLAGRNWLLRHDINAQSKDQKAIQSIIGRYSLSGVKIDYILSGHIHATRNTDIMARGSSMPGSNDYNEQALNLFGLAGQNIFIVDEVNNHKIAIDLQDVSKYQGYEIIEELEAYNAKSASKMKQGRTILEITI